MLIMHCQNMESALLSRNEILLYVKVPKRQLKVIFSWSFGAVEIWLYPK